MADGAEALVRIVPTIVIAGAVVKMAKALPQLKGKKGKGGFG